MSHLERDYHSLLARIERLEARPDASEARPAHPTPRAPVMLGKATATIPKGFSGTVKLYFGEVKGSEVWGGTTIQAYSRMGTTPGERWVYVVWVMGGWEVLIPEC